MNEHDSTTNTPAERNPEVDYFQLWLEANATAVRAIHNRDQWRKLAEERFTEDEVSAVLEAREDDFFGNPEEDRTAWAYLDAQTITVLRSRVQDATRRFLNAFK